MKKKLKKGLDWIHAKKFQISSQICRNTQVKRADIFVFTSQFILYLTFCLARQIPLVFVVVGRGVVIVVVFAAVVVVFVVVGCVFVDVNVVVVVGGGVVVVVFVVVIVVVHPRNLTLKFG